MTQSPHNERFDSQDLAVEIAAIQPRLYGFILKRLADREQTLEVLQRTNLVICQKAADFQQGSSFAAWAFTIARFQVMAWRKSEAAGRLVFSEKVYELLDRDPQNESASVDQRIPLLRNCLSRLRDADRELIQARYRDGVKLGHFARSLGLTADAIGMRLTRIRRQLAKCVHAGMKQEARLES